MKKIDISSQLIILLFAKLETTFGLSLFIAISLLVLALFFKLSWNENLLDFFSPELNLYFEEFKNEISKPDAKYETYSVSKKQI